MVDTTPVSSIKESFGRYEATRVPLLLIIFAFFAFNGHFLTTIFLLVPGHHCKLAYDNNTGSLNRSILLDLDDEIDQPSVCSEYRNATNTTAQCTEYVYDDSVGKTMVDEFNLVCDRAIYKSIIILVHMAITRFTLIISGYIADRFGRKTATLVVTGTWSVLTCAASFITGFWWCITPWVMAMSVGSAMVVLPHVLAMELVSSKYRPPISGLLELSYWIYGGIFPLVAYAVADWRVTARALGFIGVALTAVSAFWLDESPAWLLTAKKTDHALAVLRKVSSVKASEHPAAVTRGVEIPAAEHPRPPGSKLRQLVSFPHLRRKFVILVITQVGLDCILYGPPIGLQLIKLNPYYLFAVQNIATAPMSVLVVFLIDRFGRVRTFVILAFTSGISCMIGGSLPASQAVASGVVLGFSRSLISGSYVIYYMLGSEVLPTEIRSLTHSLVGLIAGLISAGVPFLFQYLPETIGLKFIPFLISGFLLMVASVLVLPFPETQNKVLVDYTEESEIVFPITMQNAWRNLGCQSSQPDCIPPTGLDSRQETPF